MKRMNGLELVENLNKVSEEIEAIFNSYKGEELSYVDSIIMDRLETEAHIIKKALEDIQVISDKIEFGVAKFRPAFYTAMELAEDRYRKAKGYLMSKEVLVDL